VVLLGEHMPVHKTCLPSCLTRPVGLKSAVSHLLQVSLSGISKTASGQSVFPFFGFKVFVQTILFGMLLKLQKSLASIRAGSAIRLTLSKPKGNHKDEISDNASSEVTDNAKQSAQDDTSVYSSTLLTSKLSGAVPPGSLSRPPESRIGLPDISRQ
jgi:hypothetical protein